MNYVDVSPLRVEALLPPLPELDEIGTGLQYRPPQTQKYCAYQIQQDSGMCYLFPNAVATTPRYTSTPAATNTTLSYSPVVLR